VHRANKLLIAAFALLLALFGWGLVQLLLLRFSAGDVFPAYSSLRSDPLGAKAFHEALERLPGRTVRRNYQPLGSAPETGDATWFYLGAQPWDLFGWGPKAEDFERVAAGGGRLVFTFFPVTTGDADWLNAPGEEMEKDKDEAGKAQPKPDKADKDPPEKCQSRRRRAQTDGKLLSCDARWGFRFALAELPDPADPRLAILDGLPASGSVPGVSWHGMLYFDELDKAWSVVARCERRPVLIERKWGKGTIVLCADSYLLSNEAMRDERVPDLLAWLVGDHRTVVFDETHLGVQEQPGVMTLARKYGLHGFFAGLLVLAALYIWKRAVPFLPARDGPSGGPSDDLAAGRDSAAGLVNLLRRTIPARDVLGVCVEEWKKSFARRRPRIETELAEMRALVSAEAAKPVTQRNPVPCYQQICKRLKERLG